MDCISRQTFLNNHTDKLTATLRQHAACNQRKLAVTLLDMPYPHHQLHDRVSVTGIKVQAVALKPNRLVMTSLILDPYMKLQAIRLP